MSLQEIYQQYLAAPKATHLTNDASLHYITTLTTYSGSADILKHLNTQAFQLAKNEEKLLNVVEGHNSIAAEVHTSIEFKSSGGAYLPSLDDNFLADRIVNLPIIHFVHFENGKISQIRQAWDQGSLLKVIDVIGKTGRNWPIRDGKDQIKLINSSVNKCAEVTTEDSITRARKGSSNATRDPHASLSLFTPREEHFPESTPAAIAHRASAKPPPRAYNDLFVGQEANAETIEDAAAAERPESPSKGAKAGAGKNYLPSRLFDTDENVPATPERVHGEDKFYKPNPAKFKHFEIGARDDAPQRPSAIKSKHSSQWDFNDFNTPAKVVPSKLLRTNDVRHWGNEDDTPTSPVHLQKVDKPRRDAEVHFELKDDGTPGADRRMPNRPRGAGINNGLGLYQNNVYAEDENAKSPQQQKVINNPISAKDREKDFAPHFSMTDVSPAGKKIQPPMNADRAKAVKMMDANWSAYDSSPNQKENAPPSQPGAKGPLADVTSNRNEYKGISIGGDGMGGKIGASRSWGFGDESGGEGSPLQTRPGKAQTQRPTGGDFWDF